MFVRIKKSFLRGVGARGANPFKPAFTLVEIILVMTLMMMLSSIAIGSILRTQNTFQFNAATQQVFSIVREARSFAVTGKAQIDYTDYDGDGCRAGDADVLYPHVAPCLLDQGTPDYVTPANYGIHFDTANKKLIMFADMHGSTAGVYNAPVASGLMVYEDGRDMHLAEYQLPDVYQFFLFPVSPAVTNTVMFSPIFADTTFDAPLPNTPIARYFFVFGVEEATGFRKSCMAIQRVGGIPESYEKVGAVSGTPCGTI